MLGQRDENQSEDLRSLRSEYDYKSKKNFADLVSARNPALTSSKLAEQSTESALRTTGLVSS